MTEFDGREYTHNAVLEELSLIERHARDGSAVDAGCACIEEKHLLLLAGLASEGVTLAKDQKEKEYYMWLASHARELRRQVLDGDFKTMSCHMPISYTVNLVRVHRDLKKDVAETEMDYGSGTADIHINPKLQVYPKLEKTVVKHEINEVRCGFKCMTQCHNKAVRAEPKGHRAKILKIVKPNFEGLCRAAAPCP